MYVPREEQPSRIASSIFGTFTKKVLVSECAGRNLEMVPAIKQRDAHSVNKVSCTAFTNFGRNGSCGEGCGSLLMPNVYALNRTRTKPRSGEQAQIYLHQNHFNDSIYFRISIAVTVPIFCNFLSSLKKKNINELSVLLNSYFILLL